MICSWAVIAKLRDSSGEVHVQSAGTPNKELF
jgi:hypothetical protein